MYIYRTGYYWVFKKHNLTNASDEYFYEIMIFEV